MFYSLVFSIDQCYQLLWAKKSFDAGKEKQK
jgi:hypothetical protein